MITTFLAAAILTQFSPAAEPQPKVVATFAFFGCNRIDAADYERTKIENPSSANIPQLTQNLTDVAKLAPDYLFFGGDLVMGYADDQGQVLRTQMTAWNQLIAKLPRAKQTRFVAIAGNHELNRKVGDQKLPNVPTDSVWSKLVRDAGWIPGESRGPTAASSPEDNLVGDQSALSFSFNRGPVHYVILNTDTRVTTLDPVTGETKIGMVPTAWLNRDLDQAEHDKSVRAVIVMGHRNLINPASAKGDAPIDPSCAEPMIKSLQAHSKVRAYVCAHVHVFDITAIGPGGVLQTCFGNGGSKLEKGWKPAEGRTFGFGYFKVYADGSVGVLPYLRSEPKDYMSASKTEVVPASPRAEIVIPARR